MQIEMIQQRQMYQVQEIENRSFPDPWRPGEFLAALRCRYCVGLVALDDDEVLGYMIYELHKHKLALLSIATHPARRNEGVGTALVKNLMSKLGERRSKLELSIGEANLDGQMFSNTAVCGRSRLFVIRGIADTTLIAWCGVISGVCRNTSL